MLKSNRMPTCYLCGQEGHTKPVCPKNPSRLTQMCFVPRKTLTCQEGKAQNTKVIPIKVNGRKVKALLDAGSTQTLVHRKYVPGNLICTRDTIPVCCVHGDEKLYPSADLYIEIQGQSYLISVGVAENLPFPVVLGDDLSILYDLIKPTKTCNVVTRAQSKLTCDDSLALSALPFFDAELEAKPGKSKKPRSQKRQEKFRNTIVKVSGEPNLDLPSDFKLPTNIVEMQQNDPTLSKLFLMARKEEPELGAELAEPKEFFFYTKGHSISSAWSVYTASCATNSSRYGALLGPLYSLGWPPGETQVHGTYQTAILLAWPALSCCPIL